MIVRSGLVSEHDPVGDIAVIAGTGRFQPVCPVSRPYFHGQNTHIVNNAIIVIVVLIAFQL